MEKHLLFIITLALCSFSFVSCSSDNDTEGGNSSAPIQVNDELWYDNSPFMARGSYGYGNDGNVYYDDRKINYELGLQKITEDGAITEESIALIGYANSAPQVGDDLAKTPTFLAAWYLRYRQCTYEYVSGSAIITGKNDGFITVKFDNLKFEYASDEYNAPDFLVVNGVTKCELY